MKRTECQEKNQIFEEKSEKKVACINKQLQSKDLETLDFYLDKYNKEPIADAKERKKIEKSLPNYLHIDKKKATLDHFYFDVSIIDNLQRAEKGGFICPICSSGLHSNKSGALYYDNAGRFFHCFACNVTLFTEDHSKDDFIASELSRINCFSSNQEAKESFQENIEDFHKQLEIQDLELSHEERKAFIIETFANRYYSDATIDYVANSKLFHVKINEKGFKTLYATMFDKNLQEKIGYQKLYYSYEQQRLVKIQEKGSILGFTLLSDPNCPNCCFVVESLTNALAIYECGYNAVVAYTKNKQPYIIYDTLLQNGMRPILFLDKDVQDIDYKYHHINWQKEIDSNFSPNELKEKADASDLLVLSKEFLTKLLRNSYNTYYKKLCYSELTLEEAFKSTSKLTIIQAPLGEGKTKNAIDLAKEVIKNAQYPLVATYTKEESETIGAKIDCNIVNSDCPIINDDKHGVVTTQARLGKTTNLEDYAIYQEEQDYDVAIIDEKHRFVKESDTPIVQPYFQELTEDVDNDFLAVLNNQQLITKAKEGCSIECIGYKQQENTQAIEPIKMAREIPCCNVAKYQDIYLNKKYNVKELVTPCFYDKLIEGTTNIYTKKIDSNLAYFLAEYTLNDTLEKMMQYNYNDIKEQLKDKCKKEFKSIRNLYLALSIIFFRNCYISCAFPIRKKDNKLLSFDEWKESIRCNEELINPNNEAIYFKVHLRYVNLQPLLNILHRAKRVILIGASEFIYQDSFVEEFKACFGNDFSYCNIAPKGIKEKETSIVKVKKLNDDETLQLMKELSYLDVYKAFVFPTYERTDDFYRMQQRVKINCYARVTKEGFKSLFSDDNVELQIIDNSSLCNPFKNLLIHGNAPILESSNKLALYTLLILDCNQFKPKISYANPYLEDLGVTVQEQLKTKLTQTIGRLYRQKGNTIVIALLNYQAIEFDLVTTLKEKCELVKVYEDSNNYSYYKTPKDFVANISKALQGEEMTKYKVKKHVKKTAEQKEQAKQEQQEQTTKRREERAIQMLVKEASEREIQRANNDYKEYSAQETLAYYKQFIAALTKTDTESPFNLDIRSSKYVCFDLEVFPNKFIACFHDIKGNGYGIINPELDWLCHFVNLPLIGFNNARYDNPILYKALCLLQPTQFTTYEIFLKELKAFSDAIIANKDFSNKHVNKIQKIARAIGFGDALELVTKNVAGYPNPSIKQFMLDLGLPIIESPYPFDAVLTDEQAQEVINNYCMNDSKAVYLHIQKEHTTFQASCSLVEMSGLNGNYSKMDIYSEIIYNKELLKSERLQYNHLTLDSITKDFPNFRYIPGMPREKAYVNEFDDYLYILGDGGFNLLPKNVYRKVRNGDNIDLVQIEENNGLYWNVIDIDLSSMHPSSAIAMKYFGEYTKYYKYILDSKDICTDYKNNKISFETAKEELAKRGFKVDSAKDVKKLRASLKLFLNSSYGLTCQKDTKTKEMKKTVLNKCSHNLIAQRGSAFLSSLHHELIKRFPNIVIIQMKTDSIKIANCTEDSDIVKFCYKFAQDYCYKFDIEAKFKAILCKGAELFAITENNALISANTDEEAEDKKIETENKGTTFKSLYDDRGVLRNRNDLRSLLIKFKAQCKHVLGNLHKEGKNTSFEYVKDVNTTKVEYYLAVKKDCQEGLYPFYLNKNGVASAVSGFKGQRVITIYDLKELDVIDKSIIDFDFYQERVKKVLDVVLNTILYNRLTLEEIQKIDKLPYERREVKKLSYCNEEEKAFYNDVKSQVAFI